MPYAAKHDLRVFGLITFNADAPHWLRQYVKEMRVEVEKVTP